MRVGKHQARHPARVVRAGLDDPEFTETQENGRIRHWGYVEELDKYLRVAALEDGETVHNAMPDRNFTQRQRRRS